MAFSHSSTFGPRMKCWDSITAEIAASSSALMVVYCAWRSSSGTFIFSFFLQLTIGFASLAELRRQRLFLAEIQAAHNAWLNFLITKAALRAHHDSVEGFEPV